MLRNKNNPTPPIGQVRNKFPKKRINSFLLKSTKRQFDFKRDQSWSQLSCFNHPDYPEFSNPQKWYEKYVLGMKEPDNVQLLFGSAVDKRIQADPTFIPELERFPHMQFKLKTTYKKIPLVGYLDGWHPIEIRIKDDKTGVTPWTQERADKTGQLTMYCLMLYLEHGIKPEKVKLQIDWIPTVKLPSGQIDFVRPIKVVSFHTKRTMTDIMKFANYIEETYAAMQKYVQDQS